MYQNNNEALYAQPALSSLPSYNAPSPNLPQPDYSLNRYKFNTFATDYQYCNNNNSSAHDSSRVSTPPGTSLDSSSNDQDSGFYSSFNQTPLSFNRFSLSPQLTSSSSSSNTGYYSAHDSNAYSYPHYSSSSSSVTSPVGYSSYSTVNSYPSQYNSTYQYPPVQPIPYDQYYNQSAYSGYRSALPAAPVYTSTDFETEAKPAVPVTAFAAPAVPVSVPSAPRGSKSSRAAATTRKHSLLPDEAVNVLEAWFEEHKNNPYPQQHEKEQLAEAGNITIKQVSAWFSNRRNRTQNTKPKRLQRVLEKELTGMINELVQNPLSNKDEIMAKFRHLNAARL